MKTELTFHARLQNRILWAANIITMVLFIALVVSAIILKNTAFIILGCFGAVIFSASILFQAFKFYTISSYISVYSIMFLGFMNVMFKPSIDPDYLYMLISYSAIAMVLSGLLARQRSFPLVVWFIEMVLLSYYFFGEQVPEIRPSLFYKFSIISRCITCFQQSCATEDFFLHHHAGLSGYSAVLLQCRDLHNGKIFIFISVHTFLECFSNGNCNAKSTCR